jgi:hypothetical protein
LQALDGDGYRSQVDAVVWATLSAVIAVFPSCESQPEATADYCFEPIVCKEPASRRGLHSLPPRAMQNRR